MLLQMMQIVTVTCCCCLCSLKRQSAAGYSLQHKAAVSRYPQEVDDVRLPVSLSPPPQPRYITLIGHSKPLPSTGNGFQASVRPTVSPCDGTQLVSPGDDVTVC